MALAVGEEFPSDSIDEERIQSNLNIYTADSDPDKVHTRDIKKIYMRQAQTPNVWSLKCESFLNIPQISLLLT